MADSLGSGLVHFDACTAKSIDKGYRSLEIVALRKHLRTALALGRGETVVDAVVVATPLEFTNLSLPLDVGYHRRPYQSTYVALAAGILSREAFGDRADELDTVLTVETTNVSFSCIGAHGASTGGDPIYKVMSRQRLSDDELDAYVFERRSSSVARADWNASGAYTKLEPSTGWPPFVLRNRLFYANMESPVSCMETQIISGKNAALLVAEALPL